MPEGFHPFPYRTRKLRPPGPMILGAQAPGKVGHRQVTSKRTISNEVVFLRFLWVSSGSHTAGVCVTGRSVAKSSSAFRVRSTLQEYASWVAVWRKAHPTFVPGPIILGGAGPWKRRIHTAGVCVMSRSVAIVSSDYRIAGKQEKDYL